MPDAAKQQALELDALYPFTEPPEIPGSEVFGDWYFNLSVVTGELASFAVAWGRYIESQKRGFTPDELMPLIRFVRDLRQEHRDLGTAIEALDQVWSMLSENSDGSMDMAPSRLRAGVWPYEDRDPAWARCAALDYRLRPLHANGAA